MTRREPSVWFMSMEALAGNPGLVRFNPIRWLVNSETSCMMLGLIAAAIFFGFKFHWGFWCLAIICLIPVIRCWQILREHAFYGNAIPGCVVSAKPIRIAFASNLSTSADGDHPAIKVLDADLISLKEQKLKRGSRVVGIAVYSGQGGSSHWDDFYPIPADCLTSNRMEMQRLFDSIPKVYWDELRLLLKQVPRPLKPGTYYLDSVL